MSKIALRVAFVDNRIEEITHLWEDSGCVNSHYLVPVEKFDSLDKTCDHIEMDNPDVVVVGYGLGKPGVTGVDVIKTLAKRGKVHSYIFTNTGGDVNSFAEVEVHAHVSRNPESLKQALDQLSGDIAEKRIEAIRTTMPFSVADYHKSERDVMGVLQIEDAPTDIVEAVLEAFLQSRPDKRPGHGYWVHSLSHFTNVLWRRRMDKWIKKFHEVAFKGAIELKDPNCSDRLLDDFRLYANWDDTPADFSITEDILLWLKKDSWIYPFTQALLEAGGRFDSPEAFEQFTARFKK